MICQTFVIRILRYYSIESHFISAVKVKKIFNISTKASQSLINDQLTHLIMNAVEGKLLDLYYFSLEALRNSLEPQYVAGFTYSDSYGRVDNAVTRRNVLSKKENLDAFASLHGITPSVDTLKKISKGKWLIDSFAKELLVSMNELKDKCAEELIISCRSCASESYDKCLYRVSSGFTKVTIKNLLLSDVEGAEVQYILDRMYDFKRADTGSECHTLLN